MPYHGHLSSSSCAGAQPTIDAERPRAMLPGGSGILTSIVATTRQARRPSLSARQPGQHQRGVRQHRKVKDQRLLGILGMMNGTSRLYARYSSPNLSASSFSSIRFR